jgi:hypothetical protein
VALLTRVSVRLAGNSISLPSSNIMDRHVARSLLIPRSVRYSSLTFQTVKTKVFGGASRRLRKKPSGRGWGQLTLVWGV